jgi:hypothetical protein
MSKKSVGIFLLVLCSHNLFGFRPGDFGPGDDLKKMSALLHSSPPLAAIKWMDSLYDHLRLSEKGLSEEAWYQACIGYQYLKEKNLIKRKNILTICDYSQSSMNRRFYVIDIEHSKLLFQTWVAHGRNSGGEFASRFSNKTESFQSSLGFMKTSETYQGGNGYSLRLDGLEPGINSNIRKRDIVIHGSSYVSRARASNHQMMGRSFGCPALPEKQAASIIDCIKAGTCFFVYSDDNQYRSSSGILSANLLWSGLVASADSTRQAADSTFISSAQVK